MGVVYKAEDTKLHRTVALKFLPSELTRDEEAKKRFIHEAEAASSLQHSNICTIHDIDETEDGQIFICMDCYEGETLKKKIERGQIKTEEAIDIVVQVASGLQKAHEKGIIHRDIKPANIFITSDGVVKILDFGLAKLSGQTMMTKMGSTMGTTCYMSPEQTLGEKVDHRTDIWSLGVVLYEMMTGELPFKGDYEQAVIYAILNQDIRNIRDNVPLPADIKSIICKLLEKNPDNRYQETGHVMDDLTNSDSYISKGKLHYRKTTRKISENKLKLIGFTVIILLIAAAAGYFIIKDLSSEERTDKALHWDNSIAVLPFKIIGPEKDQEYFSDGMTYAINDKLAQFEKLKVISATSLMRFKNTSGDIKNIGAELGVSNILEGTIQREKDKIRIRAQLSDVTTGFQIWSKTFDRNLESLFNIQDDISTSIANALDLKLSPNNSIKKDEFSGSMETYEYYVKGMHYIKSKYVISFEEQDYQAGVRFFKKVIETDPRNALAYYGLCWAYEHHYQVTDSKVDTDNLKEACLKAYELEPNSAKVNALMGYYTYEYESDYEQAFKYFKRALEINPEIGEVNFLVGMCFLYHGLYELGIKYLSKAMELDPLYLWCPYKLAMCYLSLGEFNKAEFYFRKYFDIAPVTLMYPGRYWALKIKMNEYNKIEEMIVQLEKAYPGYWGIPYAKALICAAQGKKEDALKLYKNSEVYAMLGMKEEAIKELNNEIRKTVFAPYIFYYDLINNPFYKDLMTEKEFQELINREKKLYEENVEKYKFFRGKTE